MLAETISQKARLLEIETPLGKDMLVLTNVRGSEYLSAPFKFDLGVLSQVADSDRSQLLGQRINFYIKAKAGPARSFNGYVVNLRRAESNFKGVQQYWLTIRPWYWLLSQTKDVRTYTHMTVPQIFTAVCQRLGFHDYDSEQLTKSYPSIDYCVQYNESALTFLDRILSEAGIFYYFKQVPNNHILMLGDQTDRLPVYDSDISFSHKAAYRNHHSYRSYKAKMVFTQYQFKTNHYENESNDLLVTYDNPFARQAKSAAKEFLYYKYDGRYKTKAQGEQYAKQMATEQNETRYNYTGESNYLSLHTGSRIKLTDHLADVQTKQYLLLSVKHEAHDYTHCNEWGQHIDIEKTTPLSQQVYTNKFSCLPMDIPYTPAIKPMRTIPKIQTAVVVGPEKNKPHTDEQARIKVNFYWQRANENDESPSCWIRAGQVAAHKDNGWLFIPRVGHEVIVGFNHKNFYEPEAVGSVANGDNLPPFELPEYAAKIGFRTSTLGYEGTEKSHELSFDDSPGKELFKIRSSKDNILKIKKDKNDRIKGHYSLRTKGNHYVKVEEGKYDLHSRQPLTMKAGSTQVIITSKSVTIQALKIKIES